MDGRLIPKNDHFCLFGGVFYLISEGGLLQLQSHSSHCGPEEWIWSGGVFDLVGRLGVKKLCMFAIRSEWVLTGGDCFAIYSILRSQFKNFLNFMDVDIGKKW